MDKIKYVKLEKSDGSYSESIPLAVDGNNIDINGIDLNSKINELSEDILTQKTRIDNLASLEEGSTTGDAELIDIRTSYDGISYANAGDSIRKQINSVQYFNDFHWDFFPQYLNYLKGLSVSLEQGSLDVSTGVENDTFQRVRTGFLNAINERIYIKYNTSFSGYTKIFKYDDNNNFISSGEWVRETNMGTYLPSGYKYRLVFANLNWNNFYVKEMKNNIFFYIGKYDEYFNSLAKNTTVATRSNATVYLSEGSSFTFTRDNKPTCYFGGNVILKHSIKSSSARVVITISSILDAAENYGLTVDRENSSFIGNETCVLYYDIENDICGFTDNNVKNSDYLILFGHHYQSVYYGLLVDYMVNKSIPLLNESMTSLNNRVSNLERQDSLPLYWKTHLDAKIPEIRNNIMNCGEHGETFIFITDIHWETNNKYSPDLIQYLLDNVNINTILCGGDIINQGEKNYMAECANIVARKFTFKNMFFPIAFGNHDSNKNNQASLTERHFSRDDQYGLFQKQCQGHLTYLTEDDWTFYFDNKDSKTRYIFIDTGINGWDWRQIKAVANCMLEAPDEYNIFIIGHYFRNRTSSGWFQNAIDLRTLMKCYNERTEAHISNSGAVDIDFSNVTGHAIAIFGGHAHYDLDWVDTEEGYPPVILSDSDNGIRSANEDYPYVEGTITEQCFDVVTVDYNAKTIKCVRIGRGANRNYIYS